MMADRDAVRLHLILTTTLLSVLFLVGTAAAAVVNIWPPRTDDLLWRIVMLSQGINGLGNAITAVGMVLGVGLVARRHGVLIVGGGVALVLTLVVALAELLLALDYLQFRANLRADAVRQWDVTVIGSGVLGGAAAVILLVLGWSGMRAGLAIRRSMVRRSPPVGVIVGRP